MTTGMPGRGTSLLTRRVIGIDLRCPNRTVRLLAKRAGAARVGHGVGWHLAVEQRDYPYFEPRECRLQSLSRSGQLLLLG